MSGIESGGNGDGDGDGGNEDDGDFTPAEKVATLRDDPVLAPVIDEHGVLELEPAADPFARLVTSIVNQQLSVASAAAIRERLLERIEITPKGLLSADEAVLRDCGLSAQKIAYTRNLAEVFASDDLSISALEAASNEDIVEELTAISGIGDWTSKMALI